MVCSCDKHFRICVLNRQQRRYLALKCLVIGDVIGYLDIQLLITLDRYKVNFLLVENANIYFV